MTENKSTQRAAVVAAARSWIGRPYHKSADIKGVGVDRGMLLVRVGASVTPPYSQAEDF